MVTYTAKLYNPTIPNKGSQVNDSLALAFEGLRCREIDMINSYNFTYTVQVMWKVPAWVLTFQLPQPTLIIRIVTV